MYCFFDQTRIVPCFARQCNVCIASSMYSRVWLIYDFTMHTSNIYRMYALSKKFTFLSLPPPSHIKWRLLSFFWLVHSHMNAHNKVFCLVRSVTPQKKEHKLQCLHILCDVISSAYFIAALLLIFFSLC